MKASSNLKTKTYMFQTKSPGLKQTCLKCRSGQRPFRRVGLKTNTSVCQGRPFSRAPHPIAPGLPGLPGVQHNGPQPSRAVGRFATRRSGSERGQRGFSHRWRKRSRPSKTSQHGFQMISGNLRHSASQNKLAKQPSARICHHHAFSKKGTQ